MKEFRTLFLMFLALTAAAALNACAPDKAPPSFAEQPLPAPHSFSGSYLAGRFAQKQQDWDAAQNYMSAVLLHDDKNPSLKEKTFLLTLGSGDYARAGVLARDLVQNGGGGDVAQLFLAAEALKNDDIGGAATAVAAMPDDGFSAYTKPLLAAWTLAGADRRAEALQMLEANLSADPATYRLHAGLMMEMSGDTAAAKAHYAAAMTSGLGLHSAVLVSNFFLRTGEPAVARKIYTAIADMYPLNPFVTALTRRDAAAAPKAGAARAADGAGVALYDLAGMLYEKRAYDSARVYASLARMLIPQSPFVSLLLGDLAALHGQYVQAIENYSGIPADSPLAALAHMRVAEIYEMTGRIDLAADMLGRLAQDPATRTGALVSLGDLHRRHDAYGPAVAAYDDALKSMDGAAASARWPVVYARGMALERLNDWPRAEKDLLQALSLQPDNPQILNFIGYSWLNKGVHLDKATDFLRRAVALKPDDGYILDSYGWALYRAGRYAEAATWLEQAVAEVSDDATLLDHLGDAYWQAGRRDEARYKWKRAGEVTSDTALRTAIGRKIDGGLLPPSPSAHPAKEAKL